MIVNPAGSSFLGLIRFSKQDRVWANTKNMSLLKYKQILTKEYR